MIFLKLNILLGLEAWTQVKLSQDIAGDHFTRIFNSERRATDSFDTNFTLEFERSVLVNRSLLIIFSN